MFSLLLYRLSYQSMRWISLFWSNLYELCRLILNVVVYWRDSFGGPNPYFNPNLEFDMFTSINFLQFETEGTCHVFFLLSDKPSQSMISTTLHSHVTEQINRIISLEPHFYNRVVSFPIFMCFRHLMGSNWLRNVIFVSKPMFLKINNRMKAHIIAYDQQGCQFV